MFRHLHRVPEYLFDVIPIVIKSDRWLSFWRRLIRLQPTVRGIHWGFVLWLVREPDEGLIRHEAIHTAQYRELGLLRFWFQYLRFHRKYGYSRNPFEREANDHAGEPGYLARRGAFAWRNYI